MPKLTTLAAASVAALAILTNSLFLPDSGSSHKSRREDHSSSYWHHVGRAHGLNYKFRSQQRRRSIHDRYVHAGSGKRIGRNNSSRLPDHGRSSRGNSIRRFQKEKRQPKPHGKLRVQLNSLRTPDGITYPLVGALAPETFETTRSSQRSEPWGGVAYVGSEASFDATAPTNVRRGGAGGVMSRSDMTRNTMYGRDTNQRQQGSGRIRSLTVKGHGRRQWFTRDGPSRGSVEGSRELVIFRRSTICISASEQGEADGASRKMKNRRRRADLSPRAHCHFAKKQYTVRA